MGIWTPGPGPTGGNDQFNGDATAEIVDGGGGDDNIQGNDGDDTLSGGAGNDTLGGGNGADTLIGDLGDDNLHANDGNDTMFGGAGNDQLHGHAGDDVGYGGIGNDNLLGFDGNDTLNGEDGDDTIGGFEGADTLNGGAGTDFINGNQDNDTINGGDGGDGLSGDEGDDIVNGGSGNDTLNGGAGIDILNGDDGFDFIFGGAGADTISGGNDNDTLNGDEGDDQISGGLGNDVISGNAGNDALTGDAGDDTLIGGAGVDSHAGGDGFDFVGFYSFDATQAVVVSLLTQTITNDGYGNAETMSSIEGFSSGTRFADTVQGDNNNNGMQGDTGDILTGLGGNDNFNVAGAPGLVDGGDGNDTLTFFLNNSLVDSNNDGIAEVVFVNQGVVVNLALGQIINDGYGHSGALVSIENVHGGNFNDTLTGDANNNFIAGNGGDDALIGGGGDDVLMGGRGVDTHDGGNGQDRIEFGNWDATQAVVASLLTQTITNDGFGNAETFTSIEGLGGGTRFADTFEGDNNANNIFGDRGDTLRGLGGNDALNIGGAPALIDGGDGVDTLNTNLGRTLVDANNDGIAEQLDAPAQGVTVNLALGQVIDQFGNTGTLLNIENVNGTNFGDTLTGNAGDNQFFGGGGDDILTGGTGLDRLSGDDGNDILIVNVTPTDTIVVNEWFNGGNGFDTVRFGGTGAAPGTFQSGLFYNTFFNSIERFEFTGMSGADGVAQFILSQVGVGLSNNLQVRGSADTDYLYIITTNAGASSLAGRSFTYENWSNSSGDEVEIEDFVLYDDMLFFVTATSVTAAVQLTGSEMTESISGGVGNDTIWGMGGNDILNGGAGLDQLYGGEGNDALIVNNGENHSLEVYDGGAGRDFLVAAGHVTFTGTLTSMEGFSFSFVESSMTISWDIVKTMPADIYVVGSPGEDISNRINIFMDDPDTVDLSQWRFANSYWTDSQDLITVAGSDGDDDITGTLRRDLIDGGDGNDRLTGGAGDDTIIDMEGDTLEIDGGFGNDTITIGRGFSSGTVTGGDGVDQLNVGAGALDDLVFDGIEILNTGGARITATAAQLESFDTIRRSSDLAAGSVLLTLAEAGTVDLADEVAGRNLNLIGSSGDDTVAGGDKNDTINGAGGNDRILGGLGNDKLSGGAGDDILEGGPGNDIYDGGNGVDTVDFLDTPSGVNVNLALAGPQAVGLPGSDTFTSIENLRGTNFADNLTGDNADNRLEGRAGNDNLQGGDGNDFLDGGIGLDQLNGGAGDDIMQVIVSPTNAMSQFTPPGGPTQRESFIGGTGVDTIRVGGTGIPVPGQGWGAGFLNATLDSIDRLEFLEGDRIFALFGVDQMGTGVSTDFTVVGSSNQDAFQVIALTGGTYSLAGMNFTFQNWADPINTVFEDFVHGVDQFYFGAATNAPGTYNLTGSSVRETIGGSLGNDILHGGGGNDILQGNGGVDQMYGEDGDDALVIQSTDDTTAEVYDGGAGRDLLVAVNNVVFNGTFTSMEGFAFGQGADASMTLSWDLVSTMGPEVFVIGSATAQYANRINILVSTASVVNLSGWRFTNNYWSDTQDLISVVGSAGNDTITGTTRSDLIEGGLGNDIMHAGTGIDTLSYVGASAGITIDLSKTAAQATGGAGSDTISGFENVIGSAFNDSLWGTAGNNELTGGDGNDVIIAAAGNDIISDIGGTTVSISAGTGNDIITLSSGFLSGTVNAGSEIDELNASGDLSGLLLQQIEVLNTNGEAITATAAQMEMFETIRVNAGNQVGAVTLTIAGPGGTINLADELAGRAVNLTGSAARDVITTAAGNDTVNGADGNDSINSGAGDDNISGGIGNDTLTGGDGNDTIEGGAGDDVISGGAGNDTVTDTTGLTASIATGADNDLIFMGANTHQTGAVGGGGGFDELTANGNLRSLVFTGLEVLNTDGLEVTASALQLEAFETIRVSAAAPAAAVALRLSAAGTIDLVGELAGRSVTINGSSGNDIITTSDGADTILSGLGNDTVDGHAGNDNINSGSGDDTINQRSDHGRDIINGSAGTDTYRLFGVAGAETFRIFSRAEAIAAGITGLASGTEIVITRNGTNNASVIAELDNIEEIFVNALASTADNGNGTVDGGTDGGDTIMVIGDFTTSSLAYSTIHIEGSNAADTVDITGLTSAHRVVFDSHGGTDTILGDVRSQDVFNGVGLNDQRGGVTNTMIQEPAALLSFGASDGLDALVRSSIRDLLQTDLLRNDFGLGRGHTLRTELGGLAQDGHALNDMEFGNDLDALFSGLGRTMVETADDLAPLDFSAHASEALHAAPVFAAIDVSAFGQRYIPSDYDILPA